VAIFEGMLRLLDMDNFVTNTNIAKCNHMAAKNVEMKVTIWKVLVPVPLYFNMITRL